MNFNLKASKYEECAKVQTHMVDWLAEWLPTSAPPAYSVLELGSGTGLFTQKLTKVHPSMIASDLSESMMFEGSKNVPDVSWEHVNAWDLEDQKWDRIYSASLLQWSDNPCKDISHIASRLKDNGRMLHGFFISPTLPEWESIFPDFSPVYWRSDNEWMRAFESAGLKVLRQDTKTLRFYHTNGFAQLRSLHDTGTTSAPRIKPYELKSMVQQYEEKFSHNKMVYDTWTFFRIECQKVSP